jgi:hypothetical protein
LADVCHNGVYTIKNRLWCLRGNLLLPAAASSSRKEGKKEIPKMRKNMTSQQLFSAGHHIYSDHFMHYEENWLWLPSNQKQKIRNTKDFELQKLP